jgi:hypothetical protein
MLSNYAGAQIGQFWEKVQVVIRGEHLRTVELNDKSRALFLRTAGVAAMQLTAQLEKIRRQNPTNPIIAGRISLRETASHPICRESLPSPKAWIGLASIH